MVLYYLSVALVSSVLVRAAIPLLRSQRVVDVPNERSLHFQPTPRGGGIGIIVGLIVSVPLANYIDLTVDSTTLALAVAAGALGLTDDVKSLGVKTRLLAQIILGILGATTILAAPDQDRAWLVALVVVALIASINVFNFMDGINGLSGMVAIVAGLWYAHLGAQADSESLTTLGVAVSASALGFLPWNVGRARVFLGDSGSYCLGLVLGLLALAVLLAGAPLVASIAPLIVHATDTTWTLARRLMSGKNVFQPHREHVYQILAGSHFGHFRTSVLIVVIVLLACLASMLETPLAWISMSALACGYVFSPKLAVMIEQRLS